MINLKQTGASAFSIDGAILPRVFDATLNRINDVVLRNIQTGYKIILGDLAEITVDGQTTTLDEIKDIVYNHSCNCGPGGENPVFKIFDVTFDATFN